MVENRFEYEERYKEADSRAIQNRLGLAKFALGETLTQTDHWFIPNSIKSPYEQGLWFDYELGYALRIREETGDKQKSTLIITSKRLLREADHGAMTNNEAALTARGMAEVLRPIGAEFTPIVERLIVENSDKKLTFIEAKKLIESVGRKEYITIRKIRQVYRNDEIKNIEIDVDEIPALKSTDLGFSASVEIEYIGGGSLDEARAAVEVISRELGYDKKDILKKALPGLAIPYLAKF